MRRLTLAIVGGLVAAAPTAAEAAPTGGAPASVPAVIRDLACRTNCVDARTARAGSLVKLFGTSMAQVRRVTLMGAAGRSDDVSVRVASAGERSVVFRVPARAAAAGRVRARNADGARSRPSTAVLVVQDGVAPASVDAETPARPVPDLDTSDRIDAHVDFDTVFYAGARKATLRYRVTGGAPLEVAVDLMRAHDGVSIQRWTPGPVAPGAEQRIDWDGTAGGVVAPGGRYRFRVSPLSATAAQDAGAPAAVVEDSFAFLDHVFPVRGPHAYGGAAARFGAGRGGRTHQGHDVFAPCGTPLVAARGGVVRWRAWHARAGNYLVIDGDGTDVDDVYMHLEAPPPAARGARVATGQFIGAVGDTGVAHGCHLHFEMWSGPGWYEGGRPMDPLPSLRAWDAQSGTTATRSVAARHR